MLTNEQQFVLDSLRASILDQPDLLGSWINTALDTDEIVRIINSNGILLTVYPALKAFPTVQTPLRDQYYASAAQAVRQDQAGRIVLQVLNGAGVDCIALKGWEMRKYYPQNTMRQMADLDILVRNYNYEEIKTLMSGLGYEAEPESSWMHECFFNGCITVEMHKRLSDENGEIREWEKELWQRTAPCEEGAHIFRMSEEDYYIFHLVHMHRHFLHGAIGLRRIVDTWLLLQQISALDQNYLREQLAKIGLSQFERKMTQLCNVVLDGAEMNEDSELILTFAFRYGIYDLPKPYKLARVASMSGNLKNGKLRALLAAIFMPYSRMKVHFPTLAKHPILLPWYWILRILQKIHFGWEKNVRLLDYRGLDEAEYEEMKRFLKAGGC